MFDIENVDRRVEMFIFDIFIAIYKIKFVVKDFENGDDLLFSWKDWDTVIREFEIIGEASKYLLKDELLEKNYRKVVDFRNLISHSYFGISPQKVYEIGRDNLDELLGIITNLIKNIKDPLKTELIESFIEDNKFIDFIVKELGSLKNV